VFDAEFVQDFSVFVKYFRSERLFDVLHLQNGRQILRQAVNEPDCGRRHKQNNTQNHGNRDKKQDAAGPAFGA
jgi:hypothetical protein